MCDNPHAPHYTPATPPQTRGLPLASLVGVVEVVPEAGARRSLSCLVGVPRAVVLVSGFLVHPGAPWLAPPSRLPLGRPPLSSPGGGQLCFEMTGCVLK